MPRQTYNRPDSVQLQPAAAPIGTAVSVGRGMVGESPADALARGLGNLNQGVQPFLMNRMNEATLDEVQRQQQAAEQELRDAENRKKFRDAVVSGAILPEQNPHKLRHMKILAGQYDAESYAQALEASQFGKDGKLVKPHRTIEELNAFLAESRKPFDAIADPDMRAGFLAGAERAEAKFKATQQARRMQELELTHQLIMEDATDAILKQHVPVGKAPSPKFYENASAILNNYADVEGPMGRTRMNEQFVQSVVSYAKATRNAELLKDFLAKAEASGVRVSTAHRATIAAAQDGILDDSEREKSIKYTNEQRDLRAAIGRSIASTAGEDGPKDWESLRDMYQQAYPNHALDVAQLVRQAENATNPPDEKQERVQALYQSSLMDAVEAQAQTDPNAAHKYLVQTIRGMNLDAPTAFRLQGLGENHINSVSNFRAQGVNLRSADERNIQRGAEELAQLAIRDGVAVSQASDYVTASRIASVGLNAQDADTAVFLRTFKASVRAAAYDRFGDENRATLQQGINKGSFGTLEEASQRFARHLADGEITSQEYTAYVAAYKDTAQALSLLDVRAVPEYAILKDQFQKDIDGRVAGDLARLADEAASGKNTEAYATAKAQGELAATNLWESTTREIADKNVALAKAGKLAPDELLTKTRDEIRAWVQSRSTPKANPKPAAVEEKAITTLGLDGLPRVEVASAVKRLTKATQLDPVNPVKTTLMQLAYEAESNPWIGHMFNQFEPASMGEAETALDLIIPRIGDQPGGGVFSRQNPLEVVRPLGKQLARDSIVHDSPDAEETHHSVVMTLADRLRPPKDTVSATAERNVSELVAAGKHEKPEAASLDPSRREVRDSSGRLITPGRYPSRSEANLLRFTDAPVLGKKTDAEVRALMVKELNIPEDKITGDHVDSFRIITRIARMNAAIDSIRGMSIEEVLSKPNVDFSTVFVRASDRQLTEAMPKLAAKHYGTDSPSPDQMKELFGILRDNRDLRLGRTQ